MSNLADSRNTFEETRRQFFSLLKELEKQLERYLESDRNKTIGEEQCKLVEKAYSVWESIYMDTQTSELVASEIASTTPAILQTLHDFMSRVFSGQLITYVIYNV